jgi:hypothetical protein
MRCIAAASSDVYDNVISMAYRALLNEILGSLHALDCFYGTFGSCEAGMV